MQLGVCNCVRNVSNVGNFSSVGSVSSWFDMDGNTPFCLLHPRRSVSVVSAKLLSRASWGRQPHLLHCCQVLGVEALMAMWVFYFYSHLQLCEVVGGSRGPSGSHHNLHRWQWRPDRILSRGCSTQSHCCRTNSRFLVKQDVFSGVCGNKWFADSWRRHFHCPFWICGCQQCFLQDGKRGFP